MYDEFEHRPKTEEEEGAEGKAPEQGQQPQGSQFQSNQPQESSRFQSNQPQGNSRFQSNQPQENSQFRNGQPHYSQFQSGRPQEPLKREKRKGNMGVKIACITAAALLFGTISGGTMVGINMLADHMRGGGSYQVSQAETVPQTEKAEEETKEAAAPKTEISSAAAPLIAMDVSAIVEKAMPSVVAINNTMMYQSQTWFGQRQTYEVPSSGSGIIVGQNDDELLIVTNNHVVENSKDLEVVFIDEKSIPAAVKGTDAENDLAVIAVQLKDIPADTLSQIAVATLGNSDDLKVGQGVIAIGNALGYGQSVTVGYVSALDREVKTEGNDAKNLLQTDAAINPGNSGGALLNMKGEVIGINAAKYSSTEVEGMGYAIPISKVQDIIDDLMTKKTRVEVAEEKQGYLGIRGMDVDEQMAEMMGMPRGIYVTEIMADGAAASSDLRAKDIITKFDGQSVRGMDDLKEMLSYYEEGTEVPLTVQRLENGEYTEQQVTITLGHRPEDAN